ncbi:iron uptake system protein EfeO [bacterium]|nr:iron uptake system protein EfeO [bacterium]
MRAFSQMMALALMAAGAAAPAWADPIAVSVGDKGCEPMQLTVPAGKVQFMITNASSRVLEWEILEGVMIVAEQEKILPGFVQRLNVTLKAGEYAMTCGLLSNPKGVIRVTGAEVTGALDPMALVGPVAEYKVWVKAEADALVAATASFTEAVKAGDVARARALYAPARVSYERIEPIAELFSDLDASMDARADDWELREKDPGFSGFHKLEYDLFATGDVTGSGPAADRLLADARDLQGRILGLTLPPAVVVGGAAALIEEVAGSKISGEEDRYSHTDLSDFAANIEGAQKIVTLLNPLIAPRDADLLARISASLAEVTAVLDSYRLGDAYKPYTDLTEADRRALEARIAALAEDLALVPGLLGLQAS